MNSRDLFDDYLDRSRKDAAERAEEIENFMALHAQSISGSLDMGAMMHDLVMEKVKQRIRNAILSTGAERDMNFPKAPKKETVGQPEENPIKPKRQVTLFDPSSPDNHQ